ncbi:hypothetical protein EJB05_30642, partial [Eragrostis curvula]
MRILNWDYAMARKKVNLQWISNKATRRATLKNRKASLLNKTSELVTLCGIKACVVVYGEAESQPNVWPSIPEATQLLNNFNVVPDNLGNYKKTLSQQDFLRGRISSLHDMLVKSDLESHEHDTISSSKRPSLATTQASLVTLTRSSLTSTHWLRGRSRTWSNVSIE